MLSSGRNVYKFFNKIADSDDPLRSGLTYVLKTREQYCAENNLEAYSPKKYFKGPSLDETVFQYRVQTKDKKKGN
jgi:hypothetical protein